ncbi:YeeE/YedE family protein [Roseovarius faecimaris]|uniref:YeeE/YedE family protein n=1 Tax=Roseovarius faecimaris TaxID=2494550 RepID=A0A6I6IWP9_9RHOB|nr:YeeE/YedE family protein [Roseovarius faecimaris]QGX99886.1 YeeE/YedE family protein [Roseovarius faecimaris]
MLDGIPEPVLVALVGFVGGGLLGLAARLGRFCTLGAIEDYLYQGSDTRLRMWVLAIGFAGLMAFMLVLAGALDPNRTVYHLAPFSPLAHILGGLLFGYGMALAGNCGFGALARVGGGDLRSFVIVLVMGVSAYVMLSGPLAFLRVAFIDATAIGTNARGYAEILSGVSGLPLAICGLLLSALVAAVALGSRAFLAERAAMLWAAVVALAIALGWAGTSYLATQGFGAIAVESHTFTAPLGETMLYFMTSSGGGLSFGVGSVAGVWVGAFCGSLIKGHFRWEACEDPRELRRQFFGAVLMGFGAVLAMGCTIGQGISAFSVMALGAPLTFAAIFAGAALGLRQLIEGFARI